MQAIAQEHAITAGVVRRGMIELEEVKSLTQGVSDKPLDAVSVPKNLKTAVVSPQQVFAFPCRLTPLHRSVYDGVAATSRSRFCRPEVLVPEKKGGGRHTGPKSCSNVFNNFHGDNNDSKSPRAHPELASPLQSATATFLSWNSLFQFSPTTFRWSTILGPSACTVFSDRCTARKRQFPSQSTSSLCSVSGHACRDSSGVRCVNKL